MSTWGGPLANTIFRANPGYRLTLIDRLPSGDQRALGTARCGNRTFGVLHDRASGDLPALAVDLDTALLFYASAEAGPLPRYVEDSLGDRYSAEVGALVLDGVLEVWLGDRFVSGPDALPLLNPRAAPTANAVGVIAGLSDRALDYVVRLRLPNAVAISSRLYMYNTTPRTARSTAVLGSPADVARFLGLDRREEVTMAMTGWLEGPTPSGDGAWLYWRSRKNTMLGSLHRGAQYKVYVSPPWPQTRDALLTVARSLDADDVVALKVGRDLAGLLRPDKIVIHVDGFEGVSRSVDALSRALAGLGAHGVPFTAEAAGGGLISWGADPVMAGTGTWESWRLWLTNRLAVAIASAVRMGKAPDAVEFARSRLASEGVDVRTWTPSQSLFVEA